MKRVVNISALREGAAALRAGLTKTNAVAGPAAPAPAIRLPLQQHPLALKSLQLRAARRGSKPASAAVPATATTASPAPAVNALRNAEAGIPRARRPLLDTLSERMQLRPRMLTVSRAMTRERVVPVPAVGHSWGVTTNLSNLCGHGSFIMLALGYMESDVLMLRVFSAGGIVLSVLFQYYRPQPLWIPISWNTLFLLINGGMIALLISERREATKLECEDEREVFEAMFAKLGLSAVEFLHLVRLAETRTVPPGTNLTTAGQAQSHLYLLCSGDAVVSDGDSDLIGHLTKHQFAGSMSFLRFMNTVQEHERDKAREKQDVTALLSALAHDLSSPQTSAAAQDWDIDAEGAVVPVGRGGAVRAVAVTAIAQQEEKQREGEEQELCTSRASVRTLSECRVFAWDFHLLRAYLKRHPLEGNAMQVTISADLTRKLDQSRDPLVRYHQLLLTALSSGELLPNEKRKLQRYREAHSISTADHDAMLAELGWTQADYRCGYQQTAVPASFAAYERLLAKELAHGSLDDDARVRLRRYRSQAAIDPHRHLLALAKLGWTLDQFEAGRKEAPATPQAAQQHHAAITLQRKLSIAATKASDMAAMTALAVPTAAGPQQQCKVAPAVATAAASAAPMAIAAQ